MDDDDLGDLTGGDDVLAQLLGTSSDGSGLSDDTSLSAAPVNDNGSTSSLSTLGSSLLGLLGTGVTAYNTVSTATASAQPTVANPTPTGTVLAGISSTTWIILGVIGILIYTLFAGRRGK